MGTFRGGWKAIALPVLKELLVPLAGGALYGSIVGHAGRSPFDGMTAGGVAFFCLLAVQSLFLRTARHAQDDRPAPKTAPGTAPEIAPVVAPAVGPVVGPVAAPVIAPVVAPAIAEETAKETAEETAKEPAPEPVDDFISIRRGIDELKARNAWPEVGPESRDDNQKPLFRDLAYSVAKKTPVEALTPAQLLTLKMPYQAVLNAAVNFEREVRRRAEIPEDRTVPLAELFRQPQFDLSQEKIEQLDTLRRMRNGILHGFETIVYPLEAAELVVAFDRAASWFEPPKEAT